MAVTVWRANTLANSTTSGAQERAQLAALADGGYVVTWRDAANTGDIKARVFNGDGSERVAEFTVPDASGGTQTDPTVAALSGGGFLIAWSEGTATAARAFTSTGAPVGVQTSVANAARASAASFGDGAVVGYDSIFSDIGYERYGADGSRLGGTTTANNTNFNEQDDAAVTELSGGRFLLAWQTDGLEVRARILTAAGPGAAASDFKVNTTSELYGPGTPRVASLRDGGFVITWLAETSTGDVNIRARVFDASGAPLGADFIANASRTAGPQYNGEVVELKDGGFLILWYDQTTRTIEGQRYTAAGATVGDPFIASTGIATANEQRNLAATLLDDGRVAVAFRGVSQPLGDADAGVYTVILDPRDGVVTGDNDAETLYGGAFSDTIQGLGGADTLLGLDGNDILVGGSGNDTLNGGAGSGDLVDYFLETGVQGVTVNLATGVVTDTFGHADTLIGLEQIRGSAYADSLIGDAAANHLRGATGADTLVGGAGADTLNGGGGSDIDLVDYFLETGALGITLNLAAGTSTDTLGATDTLLSVEAVRGSQFADLMIGSATANDLRGAFGSDTLVGGAGADTLNGGGGAGVDLVDYFLETGGSAVILNLVGGIAVDTFGHVDTLLAVEAVRGSAFNDLLLGNAAANDLRGASGADRLVGAAGADTLNGGGGADDTVDYSWETGFQGVSVNLQAGTASDTFGDTDTVLALENVIGTGSADVIRGDGAANRLTGGGGADDLFGGGGADTFVYLTTSDSTLTARDAIGDFQVGLDKLDISALKVSAASTYTLEVSGWDTLLYVDVNGDGSQDFVARLLNITGVTDGDLIW